jgi:RimJ/RimL family protein N-acetyltransferase
MLTLGVPTLEEALRVGEWRNTALASLRTSLPSTYRSQTNFFRALMRETLSAHRPQFNYWSAHDISDGGRFVAFVGMNPIHHENKNAEISLIVDPAQARKGHGMQAVDAALKVGFTTYKLDAIYGECYHCNPGRAFWQRVCAKYNAHVAVLPYRKRWNDHMYDADLFTIDRQNWRESHG